MIASDEVVNTSAAPSAVISSIAIMAMSSATPCSRRVSRCECRVSEVRLHSAGDASLLHPNAAAALGAPGLAALLIAHMFPTCSLFAPCQPGASPPSVHNEFLRHDTSVPARDSWPKSGLSPGARRPAGEARRARIPGVTLVQ